MKTKNLKAAAVLGASVILCGTAQAALIDRGGGLFYDTELNVTWLQNANINGLMTWDQATTWASGLSYYDGVRNVTYTDWRLPTINPVNGTSMNYATSYIGGADMGSNMSAPGTVYAGSTGSEMAHLFYTTLGEQGYCDPLTSTDGVCVGPQAGFDGSVNSPFTNLLSSYYWSGSEDAWHPDYAWFFNFGYGSQGNTGKDNAMYAMAVRDGDVFAVPAPAAVWLLGSGLLGLMGVARRKPAP